MKTSTVFSIIFAITFTAAAGFAQSGTMETNTSATVATSEAAYEAFTNASINGDNDKVSRMQINGKVFTVPAGTKVQLVDGGFMTHTIRITEGSHSGRTVIIATDHVD